VLLHILSLLLVLLRSAEKPAEKPFFLSLCGFGLRSGVLSTEQTGGSLVACDETEAEVTLTVEALAENIRSEYQLFYRPRNLKRDGQFHHITLVGPPRVARIVGQSGYYALTK
jgi:hypothetical protein